MSCPIIFNNNTIELIVQTSCYLGLGLNLCVTVKIIDVNKIKRAPFGDKKIIQFISREKKLEKNLLCHLLENEKYFQIKRTSSK